MNTFDQRSALTQTELSGHVSSVEHADTPTVCRTGLWDPGKMHMHRSC
jgi:hypothetical protein